MQETSGRVPEGRLRRRAEWKGLEGVAGWQLLLWGVGSSGVTGSDSPGQWQHPSEGSCRARGRARRLERGFRNYSSEVFLKSYLLKVFLILFFPRYKSLLRKLCGKVYKVYLKCAYRAKCPFVFLRKCRRWPLERLSVPSKRERFIVTLVGRVTLHKKWFLNTLSLFVQALPQEIYRELSKGKMRYCHDILATSFVTFVVNVCNTHLLHKMGR